MDQEAYTSTTKYSEFWALCVRVCVCVCVCLSLSLSLSLSLCMYVWLDVKKKTSNLLHHPRKRKFIKLSLSLSLSTRQSVQQVGCGWWLPVPGDCDERRGHGCGQRVRQPSPALPRRVHVQPGRVRMRLPAHPYGRGSWTAHAKWVVGGGARGSVSMSTDSIRRLISLFVYACSIAHAYSFR